MEVGDSEAAQKLFSSLFFRPIIYTLFRAALFTDIYPQREEKSGDVHIENCSSVQ